jgi:hypothetical protein
MKPLLPWKSNKYYIFLRVYARGVGDSMHVRAYVRMCVHGRWRV